MPNVIRRCYNNGILGSTYFNYFVWSLEGFFLSHDCGFVLQLS